jgi:hypothetical protein
LLTAIQRKAEPVNPSLDRRWRLRQVSGLQMAKRAWLESCRARRKPVPKPRYRPAIYAVPA